MHTHGGDIYTQPVRLDYSANLNFLGMPDRVREAAMEGVRHSEHYPDVRCRRLIRALSKKEEVPEEWIACGNGAADLIYAFVLALRPKKAVLPAPAFHEYTQALESVGCEIRYVKLREEEGFAGTRQIRDALTPDTDILMLCNPNNPTGTILPPDQLDEILERCREYGIRLLLDECFIDFTDNPARLSAIHRLGSFPNLAILKAFTKIYAMPGLRLGYILCADREAMQKLAEVHQPWNVSVPAQYAGTAACEEDEYVERTRDLLNKEKKYMLRELEKMNLTLYGSGANFIFFKAAPGLSERLKSEGILIRNCANYEGLGEGYYRIAVRSHEENVVFLPALQAALEEGGK